MTKLSWDELFMKCESPIEARMCLEMEQRLGYAASGEQFLDCEDLKELLVEYGAVVFSQQEIGHYRVDFLIAMWAPGWERVSLAAVECDGHEFHGSPEAKARDAIRDHELSGHGLKVIRFTGHEIVRRADEVMGRIPEQMGARCGEPKLWGNTQRELYPEEMAEARRQIPGMGE